MSDSEPRYFPFIRYRPDEVRLAQGLYLTQATPRLAEIIIEALTAHEVRIVKPANPSIWRASNGGTPESTGSSLGN
jgi:hypothetical protein